MDKCLARFLARFAPLLMAGLAALVLAGCEAVYSPRPLGDTAVALDPAEWQGVWIGPDLVITTTVLDAEAGRLQTAWIERGAGGATLEVLEGSIRATGNWTFANTLDEKDDAAAPSAETDGAAAEMDRGPRFTWVRLHKGENQLTAWSPNVELFKVLIGDGRLPGRVTDDGVELGELTPAQLELINDPASGLLDWSNPAVFVRIAR